MRRLRLAQIAFLLLVALGFTAGCGDDLASSPTPTPSDTRPPTIASPELDGWQRGPVTISLAVKDDSSSPEDCTVSYSFGDEEVWADAEVGDTVVIREEGAHKVWFDVVDATGNRDVFCYDVLVDNTPPVTRALNSRSVQKGKTVTLKYRIDDRTPRADVSLVLKGPKNKTITLGRQPTNTQRGYRLTASLPAGTYTYTIYARDLAGNRAQQRGSASITVTPPPPPPPPPGKFVHITESGTKYHRADCQYLWHSDIEVTLAWAKANGYTPCSRCSPPQ